MIVIKNPENGAPIKNFLYQKKMYSLGVGDQRGFEDVLATNLLDTYAFLEKVDTEGKFVCKFGDFISDKHIAVIGHERGHKEEPAEPPTFVTPQEIQDAEKRALYDQEGIPQSEGVDKDGVAWYGEGLETDTDMSSTYRRKPGVFT